MKNVWLGLFVPVLLMTHACGDDGGDPPPANTPDSSTPESTSSGGETTGSAPDPTSAGGESTDVTADTDGADASPTTGEAPDAGNDGPSSTSEADASSDVVTSEIETSAHSTSHEAGTTTEGSEPSEPAIGITVGRLHSCAITASGAVKCWGASDHGQIGNGVIDASSGGIFSEPVAVQGIDSGATQISSFSDHTCAVVSGDVWCWGANDDGQLGDGETAESATPVEVSELTDIEAVAVGGEHTCALTSAGGVKCWGKNDAGQLGDDSEVDYSVSPVDVEGLTSGVKAISAGFSHTCAITETDGMQCWGSNLYGELGFGQAGNGASTANDVTGLTSDVSAIGLGEFVSCAITTDGALKCWGRNESGQLGNGESGTQVQEETPVDVTGVTEGATAVSSGYSFSCAVIAGAAKCWGDNFYYVLGNGESASFEATSPVTVTGLGSGVAAVAATSSNHACALTTAGAVKCWGTNGGALGDGTNDDSNVPVDVIGLH